MTTELKLALVAICIVLGSIYMRLPSSTGKRWWVTLIFALAGGGLGFWVEHSPEASLLGAASAAISPWLIRAIIKRAKAFIASYKSEDTDERN